MRTLKVSRIVVAALVASGLGCRDRAPLAGAKEASVPVAAAGRVAELYFTTEVAGYVEPCGCTSKPLGGIQRLAQLVKAGAPARALFDAGSLFFPSQVDDVAKEQHRLKARILARAYRQLGAAAINIGPNDSAQGAAFLRELQREGSVPLVSANVRPTDAEAPSIAQSFLREIGGIRVGITGVMLPEQLAAKSGLVAIECAPALRTEVNLLRKRGAEVVVVLAHVGDAVARDLAREVPDIDVIVRAPGTPIGSPPIPPAKAGDVLIVEAGSQGQHVGRLTLRLGPTAPERPLAFDDGGERERQQRRIAERKISAYLKEIEGYGQEPDKRPAREAREAEVTRLRASLATLDAPRPVLDGPHLRFDLFALDDSVASDADATQLLSAYYTQLRDLNAAQGDDARCAQKDKKKPVYVGTAQCVSCHEEAYAFWKGTKHATAWATLESKNKHFDLTCVGCHTVGYQTSGGFCRLNAVGELKDVGCESCHGPGSGHVADGEGDSVEPFLGSVTCTQTCHVPEHSDTFEYASYLKKITGKGHELRGGK